MPAQTVNERLRRVDSRIAGIDRRLGFLECRLYFKPVGQPEFQEVPIFKAADLGVTPKNRRTDEEISAHRYTFRINRNWWSTYANVMGQYAITPRNTDLMIPVEPEAQMDRDQDTYATLDVRVIQSTPTF